MASPSPSTWIFHSPKTEIISHFSLSSLYLSESTRSRRRAQRLLLVPKCSSSPHEESASPPIVVDKLMRKDKVKPDSNSDPGSLIPLESATRILRLKRRRRRSPILLWKRIFFASKKVRSIILLNILTVIYAHRMRKTGET